MCGVVLLRVAFMVSFDFCAIMICFGFVGLEFWF